MSPARQAVAARSPEEIDHKWRYQVELVFTWALLCDEYARRAQEWERVTKERLSAFNPRRYDPQNPNYWIRWIENYPLIKLRFDSAHTMIASIERGTHPNKQEHAIRYDLSENKGIVVMCDGFNGRADGMPETLLFTSDDMDAEVSQHVTYAMRLFEPLVDHIPEAHEQHQRTPRSPSPPVEVMRRRG